MTAFQRICDTISTLATGIGAAAMPTDYPFTNPNDVFLQPWNWTQISREQALLRCAFQPVVSVYPVCSVLQAEIVQSSGTLLSCGTSALLNRRFFTQVGAQHVAAAKSTVPLKMNLSSAGAAFIGDWEGLGGYDATKKLYFPYDDKDPKGLPLGNRKPVGFPTVGYGHLINPGEDFSKGITKEQVNRLFSQDHVKVVNSINKLIKVKVSQQQFDAVISLAFNAGPHARTPPIRHLNAAKAVVKADFTNHYITSKGVRMKGLLKRRTAEWNMFSKGVYDSRH